MLEFQEEVKQVEAEIELGHFEEALDQIERLADEYDVELETLDDLIFGNEAISQRIYACLEAEDGMSTDEGWMDVARLFKGIEDLECALFEESEPGMLRNVSTEFCQKCLDELKQLVEEELESE